MDGKIKAPPAAGRMWLVGLEIFGIWPRILLALLPATPTISVSQPPSLRSARTPSAMTTTDDDFNPRPGRVRHGNQGAKRPKSFVGEVMRAAKKAGHRGSAFKRSGATVGRSTFGRGRRPGPLSLASRSSGRRVVVMSPVMRHHGSRFRSAPLSKHLAYLKRDGVTRDGADARMFDAASDGAHTKAFAARCEEDRHHFRFTVSPEDAGWPTFEPSRAN
jgi:hypothetical protein